jgi:hypothetical protein
LMVAAGYWAPAKLTTDVNARIGNSRRMRVRSVIGYFASQLAGPVIGPFYAAYTRRKSAGRPISDPRPARVANSRTILPLN